MCQVAALTGKLEHLRRLVYYDTYTSLGYDRCRDDIRMRLHAWRIMSTQYHDQHHVAVHQDGRDVLNAELHQPG